MNKLRFPWAALSLLAPILIICALCLGPSACSNSSSGAAPVPSPTAANVQVGFITTLTGQPVSNMQSVVLNVANVRINPLPSGTGTPPPATNGKWVIIPVPSGTPTSSSPGDVPLDMVAGESQLQTFNTQGVKSAKYKTVEVVLDTGVPGFIIPTCPAGGSGNIEGCIKIPIQLENASTPLQYQLTEPLQTKQNTTSLLPIQLNMNIVATPSAAGQPYTVQVSAAEPTNASDFFATVTGTITGANGNTNSKKIPHLAVSAELSGTNTLVASVPVRKGAYSLFLPAAADIGTLYDLYVSGGTSTFAAERQVRLVPNATTTATFTVKGGQTLGGFDGLITDGCTTRPIVGATVQILQVPPTGDSTVCMTTPEQCVSVGTAVSDDSGNYPVAGTLTAPAPFTKIPIGSPTTTYVLEVGAPGYDTQFVEGSATAAGASGTLTAGKCPPASAPSPGANGSCNFVLTTAYVAGNVSLAAAAPPGTKTTVQVVAENTGTNDLISALSSPVVIAGGQTSFGFSLNIPTHAFNQPTVAQSYDLFAEAQDLYQGGTDPFTGHTVIVQSNVAGPNPPTACATIAPAGLFSQAMECSGHGSIVGTAASPNSGTAAELIKDGVQLTQAPVGPPTPAPSIGNTYNFCAPPDTYTVQRLEQGSPVGTPANVGSMATPMTISTPCPSTCFNGTGTCPGICANTIGPSL
ncbi:MAG: hypothetical protein ACLQAT_05860 [Candidatus Binataceae bacterium]